jgi:hypothetical protein
MSPIAPSKTRRTFRIPSREELVEKTRDRFLRHRFPRLQMSGLLALTGAVGFLSSFVLLKLGVESMVLRYPVAVALAYGAFLLLLRVWLHAQPTEWLEAGDVVDLSVEALDVASFASEGHGFVTSGASFEGGGGDGGFDFGFDGDLEGAAGLLVLLAVLLVAAVTVGAVIWVLWIAPALLTEVLVDGLIMTALYRRLRQPQPTYWLTAAVRRTCAPALIVALLLSGAGGILHTAVPDAHSLGAAWKAVHAKSSESSR